MTDEQLWKRRLLLHIIVRLSGLAIVMLGVTIGLTDWILPQRWPLGGAALIVVGTLELALLPLLLRKAWERE